MKQRTDSSLKEVMAPDVSGNTFAFDCWVTGAPIAGEAAPQNPPNPQPPANRIATVNAFAKRAVQIMGTGLVRMIAIGGGTTITLQPWFFDNTLGVWVKFGGLLTITMSSTNVTSVAVGAMQGAHFFVQIVTPTGALTNVGYGHL